MAQNSFQLKGGVVTTIILEICSQNSAEFSEFLRDKIDQAPQFFAHSPVLLDIGAVSDTAIELAPFVDICREFGLLPIGFKGECSDALQSQIRVSGLPLLGAAATRGGNSLELQPSVQKPSVEAVKDVVVGGLEQKSKEEKWVQRPSKVIKQPVRSGQQIYAQGADLIVLAPVNEGAEVIADGNVHVYGALRGRALAGVQGDRQAQVFCQSMEAELISIAGDFMLSDSIEEALHKKSVRVELVEQTLQLSEL